MKPSFTPCFFSNRSLYWLRRAIRRHVDLVEGREHGGGVLRILEAARDGLAQLGHFHAFFARSVVGRGRRADGDRRQKRCLRGGRSRGIAEHVALEHLAALAGAGDVADVDAAIGGVLGGGGRRRRAGADGGGEPAPERRRSRSGGCRRSSGGGRGGGASTLRRCWPSNGAGATVSPSLAMISDSTPAAGALTSSVTLSVSSSTKRLVGLDGVAGLFEPAADGRFGNGFAECGNADFSGHGDHIRR